MITKESNELKEVIDKLNELDKGMEKTFNDISTAINFKYAVQLVLQVIETVDYNKMNNFDTYYEIRRLVMDLQFLDNNSICKLMEATDGKQ